MTDSNTTPADPFSLSAEQAGNELAKMAAVASPPPPMMAPATAADARGRLDTLSRDKGWATRLLAGDVQANREFADLNKLAASADDTAEAIAGTATEASTPIFETTTGGQLPRRHVEQAIQQMREGGLRDEVIQQAFELPPITRADATMTKALQSKRHGDAEWVKRLMAGDYEARREHVLMSIILASPVEG